MNAGLKEFIKKESVFCAALCLAVASAFFVRPGKEYIGYIDFRTIALLFCLMAIVAGMQSIGVFEALGNQLLKRIRTTRGLAVTLVLLCFFSSMFITNDVALITFVPFTIFVCRMARREERLIRLIVLETIAANLGSMATPVGNPQNLYLYSVSGITPAAFFGAVLPYAAVALVLLVAVALWGKKESLAGAKESQTGEEQPQAGGAPWRKKRLCAYLALFLLCILSVLHCLPWPAALAAVLAWMAVRDRRLAGRIDYFLLFTFACFFIFIGNVKRLDSISLLLQQLIEGHELLMGIVASQFISNVPAAILLSGFTGNYGELLTAVNLGGLGTLIASLASVISFKFFTKDYSVKRGRYLVEFTAWNAGFLVVLAGVAFALI